MTLKSPRMRKWVVLSFAAVFMTAGVSISESYAKSGYGHGGICYKCGHESKMSMEKKFYKKVKFLEKKQEELGLSEQQLQTIRGLKSNIKKAVIENEAKADIVKVDIYSGLRERSIDVNALNGLIDQKYEAKKAKAKALVQGYAELKNVLSEEQYKAMKDMWKGKWKDKKKDK